MRQARFSVWRVERRHEVAGLIVQDLLRQGEAWLVDEALEQSAPEAMTMAIRLGTPDLFAMTSGIIVPVDRIGFDEMQPSDGRPQTCGPPSRLKNGQSQATDRRQSR